MWIVLPIDESVTKPLPSTTFLEIPSSIHTAGNAPLGSRAVVTFPQVIKDPVSCSYRKVMRGTYRLSACSHGFTAGDVLMISNPRAITFLSNEFTFAIVKLLLGRYSYTHMTTLPTEVNELHVQD